MEAENYLASGFGTRLAIEAKQAGWCRLGGVATVWQPSRLKGIQVDQDLGTPFLAATQVYDVRPVPRKWLSLHRTEDKAQRFLRRGMILVTCSGSVGRATLAHDTTEGTLVSHDLLRIEPDDRSLRGWIYAYLRAPTVREMMKAVQYGHIIKHLEVHHLDELPLLELSDATSLAWFAAKFDRILESRNGAFRAINEAESLLEAQFPADLQTNAGTGGFVRRASEVFFSGRRRFDAWTHNPTKTQTEDRLARSCRRWATLNELGCEVWLPNRFKRIPAEDGVPLVDSSSIFEINPDYGRRISAEGVSDPYGGFVRPGWLMMSRSGQTYGLLGSLSMATESHEGKLISDDVIRLAAGPNIDPGYLFVAMSHHGLGRPRVKALAYGSSIPHIEVGDLRGFSVPRLDPGLEGEIGELARTAFSLWAKADALENEASSAVESRLREFLASAV